MAHLLLNARFDFQLLVHAWQSRKSGRGLNFATSLAYGWHQKISCIFGEEVERDLPRIRLWNEDMLSLVGFATQRGRATAKTDTSRARARTELTIKSRNKNISAASPCGFSTSADLKVEALHTPIVALQQADDHNQPTTTAIKVAIRINSS
jgi:hypothetical protein